MYPADGVIPEGGTMSVWEKKNCPWYMEFPNWNQFINPQEQAAAEELQKGTTPTNWYDIQNLIHLVADIEKGVEWLQALLPNVDPEYNGKKVPAPAEKKKEAEAETSGKNDSVDTSGRARGPVADVDTPTSKKEEGGTEAPNEPRDQSPSREKTPPPEDGPEEPGVREEAVVTPPRRRKLAKKPQKKTEEEPQQKANEEPQEKAEEEPEKPAPRSQASCDQERLFLQSQTATNMRTLALKSWRSGTTASTKRNSLQA
ncbi:unnamed protein product [Calypogeia fissa]